MEGLVLGIDICNDYSRISGYRPDQIEPEDVCFEQTPGRNIIQTAVCKKKNSEEWLIGEAAYEAILECSGTLVDKLIRLASKKGTATIQGKCYSAEELLGIYIGKLLEAAYATFHETTIAKLVFTVQNLDLVILDMITSCMDRLGIDRDRVRIISHTEAYLYFILSQKKSVWMNSTALLDLTAEGLHYYILKVTRGVKPQVVKVSHTYLEEGFSLDILETVQGKKMADEVMRSCAERLLDKKIFSAVYLSGNGLDKCQEWGTTFIPYLCKSPNRKVFLASNVFARGGVYAALDLLREKSAYPFVMVCEGRLRSSIYLEGERRGSREVAMLAKEGDNWYESRASVNLLLDDAESIRLKMTHSGEAGYTPISVKLDQFPNRPKKTTMVQVILSFESEEKGVIRVVDLGFGDLFPSSGTIIRKEFTIK